MRELIEVKKGEERILFSQHNFINYIEIKPTINIISKHTKSRDINLVNALWDELEYFLRDDEDFKIEKIENNSISIKALRKEAFHNIFVMAKIIGRIVPFNCNLKIKMNEYRASNPSDDMLIYYFTINSDFGNFYEGSIYIIK